VFSSLTCSCLYKCSFVHPSPAGSETLTPSDDDPDLDSLLVLWFALTGLNFLPVLCGAQVTSDLEIHLFGVQYLAPFCNDYPIGSSTTAWVQILFAPGEHAEDEPGALGCRLSMVGFHLAFPTPNMVLNRKALLCLSEAG